MISNRTTLVGGAVLAAGLTILGGCAGSGGTGAVATSGSYMMGGSYDTSPAAMTRSSTTGGTSSFARTVAYQADQGWSQSREYHEWWDQDIVYHAKANVYFSPQSRTYFWFDDGMWQHGADLPKQFSVTLEGYRVVKRSDLLRRSKNSPYVMSFNPHYVSEFQVVAPIGDTMEMAVGDVDINPMDVEYGDADYGDEAFMEFEDVSLDDSEFEAFIEDESTAMTESDVDVPSMEETEAVTVVDDDNENN